MKQLTDQAPPSRPSSGKLILVVDDEPTVLELLSDLLSSRGHTIETAGNGQEALTALSGRPGEFDVVITDMKMPVMGGQELYQKIKDLDPGMAGRLIFATGDTVSEDVRGFLDATGNPVVSKPFRLEEMDRVIEEIFARDPQGGASASTSLT